MGRGAEPTAIQASEQDLESPRELLGAREVAARPLDRRLEPLAPERLEHVVAGVLLERTHRVVVEGGHEHHRGTALQRFQ